MNRLQLLASLTKGSKFVCDIGCDHGYTLIESLRYYGVLGGIAADINQMPLNQAKKNIAKYNFTDRIKCVLSDGFKNINDEFDTAIISGMGGILIKNILSSSIDKIKNKKLILEPNSDRALVRSFLSNNGFNIIDEYSIYDANKYYEIIVAVPGIKKLSDKEINYGPINLIKKEEAFIKYYQKQIDNLKQMILKINNPIILKEKEELLKELNEIVGM